jgi:hypothetical protein
MKNVALIGASGYVGNAILNELLDRGHRVTAIVRNASKIKASSPNLEVKEIDVEDTSSMIEVLKGTDAVISAYNPGWSNPNMYEDTLRVYPKILNEVKASGVKRLLIVGGAGSLFVKPGLRLVDTGTLPEAWLPGVKSMAKFFLETLVNEKELNWVFFSPAANLGNLTTGVRTGKFRLGKDDLIVDKKGESFISVEDYAMAMVDELEHEKHHQERFTIGY